MTEAILSRLCGNLVIYNAGFKMKKGILKRA
jgi:hypothetical protein